MDIFFWLSIMTTAFWGAVLYDASTGCKTIKRLERYPQSQGTETLSVIIAARDEERDIYKSVHSQLIQTYPTIEWILVNDRSIDETGSIITKLSMEDNRISAIHIKDLPTNWLGKNYALYQGYLQSSGKYLLFTDADVMFTKEAFSKAISFMEQEKVDHLTVAPNMNVKGFWLQAFVSFFLFGFSYYKRPWAANNDRSKQGTGIGAFNLLTRDAYEQIGTHEAIALRPDDDLQLGQKIKAHRLKQRIASALSLVHVEWYKNLPEAIAGLEKNTFAGLHYRFSMVLLAVFGVFLSQVLPFFAIFLCSGITQVLYFFSLILIFLVYVILMKNISALPLRLFIVFPLTALLFIYTIIRAVWLTFQRGGIVWRGTLYKLSELRKQR